MCRRFPLVDRRVPLGSRIMLCRYCLDRMLNCPGYRYCMGNYRSPRRREGLVICRWCRYPIHKRGLLCMPLCTPHCRCLLLIMVATAREEEDHLVEWQCRCSYVELTCGKWDCSCLVSYARRRRPGCMICTCDVGYGFPPCRHDLGDWCYLCQGHSWT